ncbi:MAG: LamG domain-containing protein, partial [Planctomycetes bacterium]|nr:LamG domain-containing protein [Planctomycetota bacterium]
SFLRSSREKARTTRLPVDVVPPVGDEGGQFERFSWAVVSEAGFEESLQIRQGVELTGSAHAGRTPGRFGACLNTEQGGGASIRGREGKPYLGDGFSLEFHFMDVTGDGGQLVEWPDVLRLHLQNGQIQARVQVGVAPIFSPISMSTASGEALPGEWHHLRLQAADERLSLWLNGRPVAGVEYKGTPGIPSDAPFVGDPEGSFVGHFDEWRVLNRLREGGPELQFGNGVLSSSPTIRFDRDGLLDHLLHPEVVHLQITELDEVVSGVRVDRFYEVLES